MDSDQRFEQLARASLNGEACPTTDALADFAIGQVDSATQLRIAAHVRTCPLCQFLIEATRPSGLVTSGDGMWLPRKPARLPVARPVPMPLASGRRSGLAQGTVQRYAEGPTTIDLTISPPDGERWRISGQALHNNEALVGASVTLRAGRRRLRQETDALGFFSFAQTPLGRYRLQLQHDAIAMEIRDLTLSVDSFV